MNYISKLKKLIQQKGENPPTAECDCFPIEKIFILPDEIQIPFKLGTYITLVLQNDGTISCGIERNGFMFIEPLEEHEAEYISSMIAESLTE